MINILGWYFLFIYFFSWIRHKAFDEFVGRVGSKLRAPTKLNPRRQARGWRSMDRSRFEWTARIREDGYVTHATGITRVAQVYISTSRRGGVWNSDWHFALFARCFDIKNQINGIKEDFFLIKSIAIYFLSD